MYYKILSNDFKKNPGKHFILLLFMSLSVTLAVSVFLMLVQLFTSISSMYETAQPPHFLQMHKGELNQDAIDEFNRSYPGVEYWQTVPMIDLVGDELTVISGQTQEQFTLTDCRLDISLVKQNETYDVLLDRDRNILSMKKGEIGVPVILLEQYDIRIGDEICLQCGNTDKHFVVADYVYADRVVMVDQSPVTATGRSTPATFLGFFDEIRKLLAEESGRDASLFTFNGGGACPACKGRGVIITELVFMDPVTTVCEECEGKRYSKEALSYTYHGKNVMEILNMSAEEAYEFLKENKKISKKLKAMLEVGLPYLSLGQPLSTLSGGERQRVKLAKDLDKKGNIYILDEPTTGLHASDIKSIMQLLESLVAKGNTVIVIEHNLDVMKQADYIIDIGPDGGSGGGEVVFTGTPQEMIDHGDTITAKYLRKSMASLL